MAKGKGIPRRKRYKRQTRLVHGMEWINANTSTRNIVKRYAKWFGISRLCAVQELMLLGVAFDNDVISMEKQLEIEKANRRKKAREKLIETDNSPCGYYCGMYEEDNCIEYDKDVPF